MARVYKRVETAEVQGDGSFVTLKSAPYGLISDINKRADGLPEAEERRLDDQFNHDLLIACVREWNWTDDEGNALPLPKEDAAVVGKLTAEELVFLVRKIKPGQPEKDAPAKN